MAEQFIQGKHWLEPLTPSGGYPEDVLAMLMSCRFWPAGWKGSSRLRLPSALGA